MSPACIHLLLVTWHRHWPGNAGVRRGGPGTTATHEKVSLSGNHLWVKYICCNRYKICSRHFAQPQSSTTFRKNLNRSNRIERSQSSWSQQFRQHETFLDGFNDWGAVLNDSVPVVWNKFDRLSRGVDVVQAKNRHPCTGVNIWDRARWLERKTSFPSETYCHANTLTQQVVMSYQERANLKNMNQHQNRAQMTHSNIASIALFVKVHGNEGGRRKTFDGGYGDLTL